MRKILLIVLAVFCGFRAHCAEMVNVEYIHNAIKQKWDITVPYNSALENPRVAANMKYLLTAVDVANEMLNGGATTDYGNGEFATLAAADTVATNTAVDTLVKFEPKFTVQTIPVATNFGFRLSAAGKFIVDWGDGTRETIVRPDTQPVTYTHTYATKGEYTIGMSGNATAYATELDEELWDLPAAISFDTAGTSSRIRNIWGSLGAIFPTIGDGRAPGTQPRFNGTFSGASFMLSIPENLFDGVHGAPIEQMFANTFYNCKQIISSIPENLFAGLAGDVTQNLFSGTFEGCAKLSGEIPENLFAGIRGAPATDMFLATFYNCTSLSGPIPARLFSGISGAPAAQMFVKTFSGCSGLTGSIPENLFAGITGAPAVNMFEGTFNECTNLDGEIPGQLFSGIAGTPTDDIFKETFSGCIGLTSIGSGLFDGLSGPGAANMFWKTFAGAISLTGPSAQMSDGRYLYEIWPDNASMAYYECTGLSDYESMNTNWK